MRDMSEKKVIVDHKILLLRGSEEASTVTEP